MTLVAAARKILDDAAAVFADSDEAQAIHKNRDRLDGPLRVAIAGKVKAGKSTLLNALVGEALAPTDTGECTKIVTWYRNGHTYEVLLHPCDGSKPEQLRFHRDEGAIEVDLGTRVASDVERLEITWPSQGLKQITLIDTPGIDSMTDDVSRRSFEFLDTEESDAPADAVLYLMKHIHASDLRLLEAFHDDSVSTPNPVNAIAVLSRADEIGAGRLDSMASARRIASRYGEDRRLRRLTQMVVPVAGLLAETAATLTQSEFRALSQLAEVPAKEMTSVMLSADRFINAKPETPLTSMERQHLLDRFGLFGVRLSLALMRRGAVQSSVELSEELTTRSGLSDLQTVLTTLFLDRADVLKARSALLLVERLCNDNPSRSGVAELLLEIERTTAEAHPFRELAAMAAIRSGWVAGRREDLADLERVLGSHGTANWQRLDLDAGAQQDEVTSAAMESIGRWQRVAESPFSGHDLVSASRVGIRSLEAVIDEASSSRSVI